MLINCLLLAISVSIDSLGIGITYGIKKTKIPYISKLILVIISLLITNISIILGDTISCFLSSRITTLIGTAILICMGIYIIYDALSKPTKTYDFDNSHNIDVNESLFLGFALSMDAFCIGFGGSIVGINFSLFPWLVAVFQILFLSLGTLIGKKINSLTNLPNNVWSLISGFLLIGIGISKFFI